jgi:hypothetical protein
MVGPPSSWSLRDREDELRGQSIGLARWPFRCRGTFTPLSPATHGAARSAAPCLKPAFDTRAESSSIFSLLATTVKVQHVRFLERVAAGGDMRFKIAFALLAIWGLGVIGLYSAGDLVHVLLLVGLMLVLLAFLKARDAAARRAVDRPADRP